MIDFRRHGKRITAAALCAALVCTGTVAIVRARQQQKFDPSRYADNGLSGDASVSFDKTLFGSDQNKSQGLEVDKTQSEDYSLSEGDENIRDNGADNSSVEIPVADGTQGDGVNNTTGNAYGIVQNGDTGVQIGTMPGQGGVIGNGTGSSGADGTGNGSGSSGSAGGSENEPFEGDGEYIPVVDEGKYGVDYDEPEYVTGAFPSEAEDNAKGVYAVSLSVRGTLKVHFYRGECPRPSEMNNYISVSANMSDGSVREGLQYCQSPEYGGDYSVEWGGGSGDCVGKSDGTFVAGITYRGAVYRIKYDIINWQLTLYDFEESCEGFVPLVQTVSPEKSPVVNLSDAMELMYEAVAARTADNTHDYKYRNVISYINLFECCIEYFGGWRIGTGGTSAVGNSYKMHRPADADIVNGVYNIDMYPVWAVTANSSDGYYIVLKNNTELGRWQTELIGFSSSKAEDATKIVIPDGVSAVDMQTVYLNGYTFNTDFTTVREVVVPESVSSFIPCIDMMSPYPALEKITVAAGNQFYLDIDGVLYNKTGKKLVCFPEGKKSVSEWSDRVVETGESAFLGVSMDYLALPPTLWRFGEYAFFNAEIGTLEITTTSQMTWGACLFMNDGSESATVKTLVIRSSELPLLPAGQEKSCFMFTDIWSSVGSNYAKVFGLKIIVPDSENDRVYLSYLSYLQAYMDKGTTLVRGTGYDVLNTAEDARGSYKAGSGDFFVSADGTALALAPMTGGECCQVPQGILQIGPCAFVNCTSVKSLIIPASVEKIEGGAFSGLSGICNIVFRNGGYAPLFGGDLFGGVYHERVDVFAEDDESIGNLLENLPLVGEAVIHPGCADCVTINGSIYLENSAGYTLVSWNCMDTYANVGGDVTEIADRAFYGCKKLLAVTFSASVASLGNGIFDCCDSLRMIAFSGVPEADDGTFDGVLAECFVPVGTIADFTVQGVNLTLRDTAGDYEIRLFAGTSLALYGQDGGELSAVRYIDGDGGVFYIDTAATKVSDGAFEGCDSITGLDALYLYSIGKNAFAGCGRIETVDFGCIPVCGEGAFDGCNFGAVIVGDSYLGYVDSLSTDQLSPFMSAEMLGLRDRIGELYGSFVGWTRLSEFSTSYGDGDSYSYIERFGAGLFAGCTGIRHFSFVTVPECADGALDGCAGFTLNFGAGFISFSDLSTDYIAPFCMASDVAFYGYSDGFSGSFSDWDMLQSFTSHNPVDKLGDALFEGCESLSVVSIANTSEIGSRTFALCKSLSAVYINTVWQNGVTVAPDAFDGANGEILVMLNNSPYSVNK